MYAVFVGTTVQQTAALSGYYDKWPVPVIYCVVFTRSDYVSVDYNLIYIYTNTYNNKHTTTIIIISYTLYCETTTTVGAIKVFNLGLRFFF